MDTIKKRHTIKRYCDELLSDYQREKKIISVHKLEFFLGENDHRDVYNISAPFEWQNEVIIAGRVERRDSEDSIVAFFSENNGIWIKSGVYPEFALQDPFVAIINNEIIIGGVEIYGDPKCCDGLQHRTVFYKGTDLFHLVKFACGPERMKDIRLLQLQNKDILVFSRPRGIIGGRGKIAFSIVKSINDIDAESIDNAVVLENQFYEEEWGGANELHLLSNGKVGVLSHIARFDLAGNRHYYSTCFCFDPIAQTYSTMKMIAAREDYEAGDAKRPDLIDVIFSGGIIRLQNGYAELYCGVSDAEAHVAIIEDPFIEYEDNKNKG